MNFIKKYKKTKIATIFSQTNLIKFILNSQMIKEYKFSNYQNHWIILIKIIKFLVIQVDHKSLKPVANISNQVVEQRKFLTEKTMLFFGNLFKQNKL